MWKSESLRVLSVSGVLGSRRNVCNQGVLYNISSERHKYTYI